MIISARRVDAIRSRAADAFLHARQAAEDMESSRTPNPRSKGGISRITRHFATNADRNAGPECGLSGKLDETQDRGMKRIVKMCNLLVRPVDRQGVHNKVVGTDGKEIGNARQCASAASAAPGTSIIMPIGGSVSPS